MEDRLVQLLKAEGINPTRFAERIGVQRSSMSHILSGRNKPSYDFIVKILESFPAVNPDWLLRGKGLMYKADVPSQPGLFDKITSSLNDSNDKIDHSKISEDVIDQSMLSGSSSKNAVFSTDLSNIQRGTAKQIEKIVIFYNDNTFSDYAPGN